MGHLSLTASKRNSLSLSLSFSPRGSGGPPFTPSPAQSSYRLLDLLISALFLLVLVFFVLVLTPLGDSLAASGRRSLLLAARDRDGIALAVESGRLGRIEDCAGEDVDFMPCEDPHRSSGLSREMNFYRERHCPLTGEGEVCLLPVPQGYRVPVQWPESLDKVVLILLLTGDLFMGDFWVCFGYGSDNRA